jgi:YVTN family beta-propeller protein
MDRRACSRIEIAGPITRRRVAVAVRNCVMAALAAGIVATTAAPPAAGAPQGGQGPGRTRFHVGSSMRRGAHGGGIDANAARTPFAWMLDRARTERTTGPATPLGPAGRGTIQASIDLPDYVDAVVEAFGSEWITVGNYQSTELVRVDLGSNAITDTISLGDPVQGSPGELAASADAIWVTKYYENVVDRIDPATDTIVAKIPVGTSPVGVLSAFGSIWVANSHGGSVTRIDPATDQVVATIPAGYSGSMEAGPWQLAAGAGAVWVDNGRPFFFSAPGAKEFVQRIDPATNAVVASIRVPGLGCDTMVAVGSSLWLNDDICATGTSITRVNMDTSRLAQTVQIVTDPSGCLAGLTSIGDQLWVGYDRKLNPHLGYCGYAAVERLDPSTGQVLGRYGLGPRSIYGLASGGGSLWVPPAIPQPRILRVGVPTGPSSPTAPSSPAGSQTDAASAAASSLVRSPDPAGSGVPASDGTAGQRAGGTPDGRVEARIHVGPEAGSPIDAFGLVWSLTGLALDRYSHLVGVDPGTNAVVSSSFIGDSAAGLAAGDGSLWVSKWYENVVERIDPSTGDILATIPTDLSPHGVLFADGSVWVATHRGRAVDRIDPSSNEVIARVAAGDPDSFRSGPAGLAAGSDGIWVSVSNIGTVQKIDPNTNQVVLTGQEIGPDILPEIAADSTLVYVWLDGTYYRLSQETGQVTDSFATDGNAGDLTFQGGDIWVSSDHLKDPNTGETTAVLTEYDPVTLEEMRIVHVGGFAGDLLATGDHEIWMNDLLRPLIDRVRVG